MEPSLTLIIFQGTVFDVSGKDTYKPGKNYHGMRKKATKFATYQLTAILVFAGKEPNRALALSSLKEEDAQRADYEDLPDDKKKVLDDWYIFFSKRYNQVGKVQRGSNL